MRSPRRRLRRASLAGPAVLLLLLVAAAACGALAQEATQAAAEAPSAVQIRVVGGLAGVSQYVDQEAPFWTRRVPELTGGLVRAEIAPFDRSGIRGQEMLQLLRLGVVRFGTALLGLAAADEPELNALDLPLVNPDMAALRRSAALWRPRMAALLRERYGVELLALYTYPAQVVFCRQPFASLSDLAGRGVRTASVAQSELIAALGGVPVVTPFAEVVAAIRNGVVQCAITGTLSGNAIGLHQVTSHVSRIAVDWGVSFFGANLAAWAALPPAARRAIQGDCGSWRRRSGRRRNASRRRGWPATPAGPAARRAAPAA
jgi:TRAP-type C4-dicarboxylate transport system substrate-binding protein